MAIISLVDESAVRIDSLPGFDPFGIVSVDMLRLDLLHPLVSGNKWYKLSENLKEAIYSGYRQILTFGGAYSNHLIAAAAAAQANGLKAIGVVRGGEFANSLNPVLQACREMGMELLFISRSDYEQKEQLPDLTPLLASSFVIPEGGANELGRRGMAALANLIPTDYSHIVISVGSGTSFEGLRNALPKEQQMIGFVPMKGGIYLEASILSHLNDPMRDSWSLTDDFALGGFGKCTPELTLFMESFHETYGIESDRVYTGKMLFGLKEMLRNGIFPKGTRILSIHTGGLSGNWSKR